MTDISKKTLSSLPLVLKNIVQVPHTKNDTIIKIIRIETHIYFCYVIISKYGRVGLYDGSLNFLMTYYLIMTREDITRKEEERRRRNRWVTDAIFCPDILMFMVTNSTRSITIYEASNLIHVALWLILSTPNIVQSLVYHQEEDDKSILFMGDDLGRIFSLYFQQPKIGLLRRKHSNKITIFYWQELVKERSYVIHKNYGNQHQETIRKICYFPDNKTLVSCSKDPETSVIITSLRNKSYSYVFKINRGCSYFALSRKLKILITGSDDGSISIWNVVMTSQPITTLNNHSAEIVDLKIIEKQNIFLSCSTDAVVKSWNIKDHYCLQTIKIKFPSFDILGKIIEWGAEPIVPGPKRIEDDESSDLWERSNILLSCCNYIAIITLNYQNEKLKKKFESQILTPPPIQNSVLIPKTWKTQLKNPINSDNFDMNTKFKKNVEKHMNQVLETVNSSILENIAAQDNINYKLACLERKKLEMEKYISEGAPYLALSLAEITEITLSEDLTPPTRKRDQKLVENIRKILDNASLKDVVFSESSSKSPRSSRSSSVELSY